MFCCSRESHFLSQVFPTPPKMAYTPRETPGVLEGRMSQGPGEMAPAVTSGLPTAHSHKQH